MTSKNLENPKTPITTWKAFIGLIVLAMPAALGLWQLGFLISDSVLPVWLSSPLSFAVCFVGIYFAIDSKFRFWQNFLLSLFYSQGTLWATVGYLWFRQSFWNLELVLPISLGAVPALSYWLIWLRAK